MERRSSQMIRKRGGMEAGSQKQQPIDQCEALPIGCLILTLSSTSRKASWSHNRRTLEAQPEEAGWIERQLVKKRLEEHLLGL